MPGAFHEFGLHFLYPDNWVVQSRDEDSDSDTVTLEMPCGGFFSVTKHHGAPEISGVLADVISAMRREYPEVEIETVDVDDLDEAEAIEMRFYYLDLLIVARVTAMLLHGHTVVVQVQAENRDFDQGEPVFQAMLKSIRDGADPLRSV